MTDLLSRPSQGRPLLDPDGRRPVVVSAALVGVLAPVGVLLAGMAIALAGWFAADQGSHGTTTDALRIASDTWLLAHGASLDLGLASISVIPLGLTAICGVVCFRLGRWAGATSAVDDGAAVAMAGAVLAAVYGITALVVAVLASVPTAEPHLGRAFAGGVLVAACSGVPGLCIGAGHTSVIDQIPSRVRTAVREGAAVAAGVLCAGGVLTAVMLLVGASTGADILREVGAGASGSVLLLLLVAAVAPNLSAYGAAYLIGPGFAVGTGTTVAVGSVVLGPLPLIPVVAVLPGSGAPPGWVFALLVVPPLVAGYVGWRSVRRTPATGYDAAALRGLTSGSAGGVLLALVLALSGGSIGPGRMTEIGPSFLEPLLMGVVVLGIGATAGAVLAHGLERRRIARQEVELTVDLSTLNDDEAPEPDEAIATSEAEDTVAMKPPED